MRNLSKICSVFHNGISTQNRSFTTKSTAFNPKYVNEAINPKPGKLFRSTPALFLVATVMFTVPVVVTYFDNKKFAKEMERRKQPGVTY